MHFLLEALNEFAVLWLETSSEEAENFWLVNPFQTADVMSSLVQADDSVSNIIQMSICINTTRNGKTNGFQFRNVVFTGVWITSCRDDAALHCTHAGDLVDCCRECLSREVCLPDLE